MHWNRSETLALAAPMCAQCHGLCLRSGNEASHEPCNCVLRAIFRACYARFQLCATQEKYMTRTNLEVVPGKTPRRFCGRKDEEYVADFCLVSRRHLSDFEYRIFRYHFLLGADWRLCTRKLKVDRGTYFHAVYRIQQKLGRLFRELQPYGLYPLNEYFGTGLKKVKPIEPPPAKVLPIRAPLQRTSLQEFSRAA